MLLLALGATTCAAETFDIIFIIDGSYSVSSAPDGPFTLQKEGIANCLAGERAFIRHEGSCAIAVVQVGKRPPGAPPETPDVTIEIPLTIIDSAATAQQKANQVLAITQGYGGTPLDDAL